MQQTNRLDFLFNASHTMFSSCPSLSRYYMNEFQETLGEYELKPTKQIERLACQSCGQISIAGLNTQKVKEFDRDDMLGMSKSEGVSWLTKEQDTKEDDNDNNRNDNDNDDRRPTTSDSRE
ncbi:unnamed protein product [Rhizopus stolonifer]